MSSQKPPAIGAHTLQHTHNTAAFHSANGFMRTPFAENNMIEHFGIAPGQQLGPVQRDALPSQHSATRRNRAQHISGSKLKNQFRHSETFFWHTAAYHSKTHSCRTQCRTRHHTHQQADPPSTRRIDGSCARLTLRSKNTYFTSCTPPSAALSWQQCAAQTSQKHILE